MPHLRPSGLPAPVRAAIRGHTTRTRRKQTMTDYMHDWQTPPTEWRYDGRPLHEFGDPMLLARERITARFGGQLPRDVSLALNEAFRRGVEHERERIAAEFEQVAGNRNPALSNEDNRRYGDIYANVVDRIRHPEKYSGVVAANEENACTPKVSGRVEVDG